MFESKISLANILTYPTWKVKQRLKFTTRNDCAIHMNVGVLVDGKTEINNYYHSTLNKRYFGTQFHRCWFSRPNGRNDMNDDWHLQYISYFDVIQIVSNIPDFPFAEVACYFVNKLYLNFHMRSFCWLSRTDENKYHTMYTCILDQWWIWNIMTNIYEENSDRYAKLMRILKYYMFFAD